MSKVGEEIWSLRPSMLQRAWVDGSRLNQCIVKVPAQLDHQIRNERSTVEGVVFERAAAGWVRLLRLQSTMHSIVADGFIRALHHQNVRLRASLACRLSSAAKKWGGLSTELQLCTAHRQQHGSS